MSLASARLQLSRSKIKKIIIEGIAFLAVVIAFLLPRFLNLDAFVTPDEELWLTRSANFYTALAQRDYINTYQKEHPGVTIMWAGMAANLIEDPQYRGSGLGQASTMQYVYYMDHFTKVKLLDILRTGRLFVVIAITICAGIAYLYTRSMVGLLASLIGFLLIAFDPFFIGLTRLLHLDGLMSALLLLSLVSFIYFLRKKRLRDLFISGGAAGFCWLTKSPGFILGIIIGIIALAGIWFDHKHNPEKPFLQLLWNFSWPVIAWASIGIGIYFIFWPAMWVDPIGTFNKVLSETEGYAEKGHFASVFFNGTIIESGDIGSQYAYYYPFTYMWRTTPVVLGGLISAGWGFAIHQKPFKGPNNRFLVFSLVVAAVIFTIVMTVALKKFDRYLLPVYPILDLIAGMGLASLVYWSFVPEHSAWMKTLVAVLGIAAVSLQLILATSVYPYYLNYFNPLLGGPRQAVNVMQVGWGEGLDQAARYLNAKPDAKDLTVYAWYSGGSFSYFFDGNAYYLAPSLGEREGDLEKFLSADYAVVYIHQWQRDLPPKVLDILRSRTPEKTIWISGLPYVQIYKLH
jgi:4-amino-4-deoxy-L-arabinose transferase-like glycosyltransferase